MRYPLLTLEKIYSVTGNQLILETHIDMTSIKLPTMRFYPGNELANDSTNWWGPNPEAIEAMLKCVGFREVKRIPPCPQPVAYNVQYDRMVFHAWR